MHDCVALAALFVWVAAIVTLMSNRTNLSWALRPVLFGSFATMTGTVLFSRFLIRHNRIPSYGTLFGIPLACACLLWMGPILVNGSWYLFTPGYWKQAKGGFSGLYVPIGLVDAGCILPAAAVVLYYQGRRKILVPSADRLD